MALGPSARIATALLLGAPLGAYACIPTFACSIDAECDRYPGGVCSADGKCSYQCSTDATATAGCDTTTGSSTAATTTSATTSTSSTTSASDESTTAGADPPALCGLPIGAFTFGAVIHLSDVSTPRLDSDPIFWGERHLYFASRPDTHVDIFVAVRASAADPFGPPSLATDLGLNAATADTRPHISADGLRVVFASDRPGGAGQTDIWYAERADPNQPFAAATPLPSINAPGHDYDPWLSADGLRLYYNTQDNPDTSKIRIATRASLADDFPIGAIIPELDAGLDASPILTDDERIIVFTSQRGGNLDLWMASRLDASQPFDPPVALPVVNTPAFEGEPALSPSGCELVFVSDRAGTLGSWDLYTAPVIAL